MNVDILYQKLNQLKEANEIPKDEYEVVINQVEKIRTYSREIEELKNREEIMDDKLQVAYVKMNSTDPSSSNYLTAKNQYQLEENSYYRLVDQMGDLRADRQDLINAVSARLRSQE